MYLRIARLTQPNSASAKMIDSIPEQDELAKEANEVIQSITKCFDRGVDPESGKRGKCHIFLDDSDLCQCKDVNLSKYRMK